MALSLAARFCVSDFCSAVGMGLGALLLVPLDEATERRQKAKDAIERILLLPLRCAVDPPVLSVCEVAA